MPAPALSPASRARLGIPGLDDLLGGGLPSPGATLLLGPVGSGKSFLGCQFLLEGLKQGEKALRLSLEASSQVEDPEDLPLWPALEPYHRAGRLGLFAEDSRRMGPLAFKGALAFAHAIQGCRALVEVGPPAEKLAPALRQSLARLAADLAGRGASVLVSNRGRPAKAEALGPALELAPPRSACLLLRHEDLKGSAQRRLTVLKLRTPAPLKAALALELGEEGFSLAAAPAAPEAAAVPMLVMAPQAGDEGEKRRLQAVFQRLMKRLHIQAKGQDLEGRLVRSDVMTALYVPQTDFGVMLLYEPNLRFLARQGLLAPLEDLFPDYGAEFHALAQRRAVEASHLYGAPLHLSTRALYYRADLLEQRGLKPPRTWDELELVAQKVLEGSPPPGLQGLLFEGQPLNRFNLATELLWSQGEEWFEGGPKWIFNAKGVARAVERLHGFVHRSRISPGACLRAGQQDSAQAFLDGRALFLLQWTDVLRQIHSLPASGRKAFGWTTLPVSERGVRLKTRLGGPQVVIPQRTRYPRAARALVKALLDPKLQGELLSHPAWPFPGRPALAADPRVRRANPYFDQAEEFLQHASPLEELSYLAGNYLHWQDVVNQELGSLLEDPQGLKDLPAALRSMEARLSEFLPKQPFQGLVAQALQVMAANLERPFSIEQLAKELGVTRSHLIREFRRQTGSTPLQMLNERKVERAKELLEFTRLNVAEVAMKLGFQDSAYFGRLFKKLAGRGASDYKRAGF